MFTCLHFCGLRLGVVLQLELLASCTVSKPPWEQGGAWLLSVASYWCLHSGSPTIVDPFGAEVCYVQDIQ